MKAIIILLFAITQSCTAQPPYFGRVVGKSTDTSVNLTNAVIIADGNSYFTDLGGATCSPNVLMTLAPFNSNSVTLYNFGVAAQTTSNMLSDVHTQVLPLFDSSVENIVIFQEGGNDLYFYGNVDSAIARTLRYCSIVRAAGFKVIVSTLIHRNQHSGFGDSPSQYNDKIDEYNAALIAATGYEQIIRPDLESIFTTYTSGGYLGDEVHPNQTGHNKYADLWKAAILNL